MALVLVATLAALAGIAPGSGTTAASRQDPPPANPMSLTIRTLDPRTDLRLPGNCYIVLGFSQEHCDDAGTGNVHIADIPPGTYSVEQTRVTPGFLRTPPFTVTVAAEGPPYQWAYVSPEADPAVTPAPLTIRITDRLTGEPIPGVCIGLAGTAISGCDDDGDGTIVLDAVPAGAYHVDLQDAPAGYRIAFTASAPIFVPATTTDRQPLDLPLRDYGDASSDSP
ncbi:MAG: MSCRAMM family protein [Thermomicrobiales bacterium]